MPSSSVVNEDGAGSDSSSSDDDSILLKSAFRATTSTASTRRREAMTKQSHEDYLVQMIHDRRVQTEKTLTLQKMELESKQRDMERTVRRRHRRRDANDKDDDNDNDDDASSSSTSSLPRPIVLIRRADMLGSPTSAMDSNHNEDKNNDIATTINHDTPTSLITSSTSSLCPTHPTLYQTLPQMPPTHAHAMDCLHRLIVAVVAAEAVRDVAEPSDHSHNNTKEQADRDDDNNDNSHDENCKDDDNNNNETSDEFQEFLLPYLTRTTTNTRNTPLDFSRRWVRQRIVSMMMQDQRRGCRHDDGNVPPPVALLVRWRRFFLFQQWLLMMACHTRDLASSSSSGTTSSSRGAYLQLMDLLLHQQPQPLPPPPSSSSTPLPQQQQQQQYQFHVRDMVEQWKVYFGLMTTTTKNTTPNNNSDIIMPNDNDTCDDNDVKMKQERNNLQRFQSTVRSTPAGSEAVGRFLAIWDRLLARGLVAVVDVDHVWKLLMVLVMAGTDPLLQDHRYVAVLFLAVL